MKYLGTISCAFALCATGAFAATVDFEEVTIVGTGAPDVQDVGMSYTNGMITFTSTEQMNLVKVGGNRTNTDGFVPNDTPKPIPDAFGSIFLSGDFSSNTDMAMSFATDLTDISFQIADIDGAVGTNQHETFVFSYWLNDVSAGASQTVSSADTSIDGQVVNVSFAGLFDEVRIVGTTPNGGRNIGWGIDNIEIAPVPVPAAGLMLLTALGGFGLMRRRKKAS